MGRPENGCNCKPNWCPEPSRYDGEGKNVWPELVGEKGEVAAATIERENSGVHAIIIRPGTGMTQDLRPDRVHVRVDSNDIVLCAPYIA